MGKIKRLFYKVINYRNKNINKGNNIMVYIFFMMVMDFVDKKRGYLIFLFIILLNIFFLLFLGNGD